MTFTTHNTPNRARAFFAAGVGMSHVREGIGQLQSMRSAKVGVGTTQ